MEKLYFNGKIFTGTGKSADSFTVEDGKFKTVGRFGGTPPEGSVDLRGKTVIPGLVEAHIHSLIVASAARSVPCTIPLVTDIESLVAALKTHPNFGRGGDLWITGWGYDESKLAEHRTPTREDLDRVSKTQPVYVIRSDCHSGICNSKALELAGITRETKDPEIGAFLRDANGEPNGVLFELEANARVRNLAEKPDFGTVVQMIADSARHFHERGYSAVTEMMARLSPLDHLKAFREAEKKGFDLQAALYLVWEGGTDPFGMRDLEDGEKRGRIRFAGLKLFADGSVSGRTAWVHTPYTDGTTGLCTLSVPEIAAAHAYAARNGLQLSIHVMGDRSLDRILDYFEGKEPWCEGVPSLRLEHVTLVSPAQLERVKNSPVGIALTTQVIFAFAEYESYAESLTKEVFGRIYPVRMLSSEVEPMALSSDSPATTWMDPDDAFVSLEAAVTRKAYNGKPIGESESVPLQTALELYTGRAAKVLRYETPVGTIQPGAEADFNILTEDLFSVPENEIRRVRVEEAWMKGERVFRRS